MQCTCLRVYYRTANHAMHLSKSLLRCFYRFFKAPSAAFTVAYYPENRFSRSCFATKGNEICHIVLILDYGSTYFTLIFFSDKQQQCSWCENLYYCGAASNELKFLSSAIDTALEKFQHISKVCFSYSCMSCNEIVLNHLAWVSEIDVHVFPDRSLVYFFLVLRLQRFGSHSFVHLITKNYNLQNTLSICRCRWNNNYSTITLEPNRWNMCHICIHMNLKEKR